MKLSTLLLSSAALVVAGSAYAADLPAKKGAPAAKAATGCPAFGAGFFQIPGGDTCIKFSGYARYTAEFDSSEVTHKSGTRLEVTSMSNTDMGALTGYVRVNATPSAGTVAADRGWVQIGGLQAGTTGSLADIAGTNPISTITGLGGAGTTGVNYSMAMGAATLSLGAYTPADDTASDGKTTSDVVARVKFSAAGASFTAFGASHNNDVGQGWAFGGKAGFAAGPATINVGGGVSSGAIAYTGVSSATAADSDGTDMYSGSTVFGEVLLAAGPGTLYADVGQVKADTDTVQYYAVGYNYALAKNLTVTPEYGYSNDDSDASSSTFYVRIQRDF